MRPSGGFKRSLVRGEHRMKQIPLSTTHARLGAVFAEFSGWEIPRHYGDSAKEHSAVRGGAGLCDRSFLGKMRVCGKDRQEFLHSLVSNNVKSLRASEGTYATLLTPKGKMLGDLWIYVCEEDCLILTEACAAQTIAQTLEKYILMSDVSLENQTESHGVLSIFGPHSAHLVRTLLGELPAGALPALRCSAPWPATPAASAGSPPPRRR